MCCAEHGLRESAVMSRSGTAHSSLNDRKAAPCSVPPVLKRRLDDGLLCVAVCAFLKHIVGVAFTALVLLLCVVLAPFIVAFRLIYYIRIRIRRKAPLPTTHCDPWWPLKGDIPFRCILTLHSNLDQNLLNLQMTKVFAYEENTRCSCSIYGDLERNKHVPRVKTWDQQKAQLKLVGDLLKVLNDPSSALAHSHSSSSVMLVPNFSNVDQNSSSCSLAIFSHNCYKFTFCLPRLLCLYTSGQLVFDMEPKMGESFSPQPPNLGLPIIICHTLAQAIQFICIGPLTVATMSFRRPSSIWKFLPTESKSSLNRRRKEKENGDEAVLMENIGDDNRNLDSTPPKLYERSFRWMRVTQTDQLLRAERILRAATVELFLAFIAGAIRSHFRSSGIAHPPDLGAAVPVSYREYVPVESSNPCNMMLLPMQIPCGVEGAIPRVWAVQRRMADALDGVLPTALRISRFLAEFSLTSKTSRSVFSSLHADSSVVVSVLRASGDVQLDNHRIQSILLYPSLPPSVKAAFTFVQCGSDIMLSLSACKQSFPEPDRLLIHFKTEVRCLLEQLSMRLLTLSQTTFLPTRVPLMRSVSEEGTNTEEEAVAPRSVIIPTEDGDVDIESCSVEQLKMLVNNVQKELDAMRDSPHVDRAEFVLKLGELENRMKIFHDSLASRLGSPSCSAVNETDEIASNAVADLLAPYRQESVIRNQC